MRDGIYEYNVWIHIEGVNKGGDVIEGDEYHEPRKVGNYRGDRACEDAHRLCCHLMTAADEFERLEEEGDTYGQNV